MQDPANLLYFMFPTTESLQLLIDYLALSMVVHMPYGAQLFANTKAWMTFSNCGTVRP